MSICDFGPQSLKTFPDIPVNYTPITGTRGANIRYFTLYIALHYYDWKLRKVFAKSVSWKPSDSDNIQVGKLEKKQGDC